MAKRLKAHIEKALEELETDDLKRFKRQLNSAELEPGYKRIPKGRLEKADFMDLADAIVNHYREGYGLRVTAGVLEEINQKVLADELLEAVEGGGASGSSVPPTTKSEAEASAVPPPAERHFVDQHRKDIIARTSLVAPILDVLLHEQLLTQEHYSSILANNTPQNRMRDLYSIVNGWGKAGKDHLYEALKHNDPALIRDLEEQ